MKPNILFLVFDSFRADKFYNNKTSKTPTLDNLIKHGACFTQAVSSADGTTLSLNSIFTGLYPFVTGTREIKLSFENRNYIRSLKENGYNLYGIMPKLTSLSPLIEMCLNTNSTYNGGPPAESLFNGVGQKIIDALLLPMKEPWFYYVHIMDLHWPLVVPAQYNTPEYGSSEYDKVVSSTDHWLGRIMSHVNLTKTLTIITADHGTTIPFDGKNIANFEPDLNTGLKIGKKIMPKTTHSFGAKIFNYIRKTIQNARIEKANKNITEYDKRSRLPYYTLSLFDELIRVPLLFVGYTIKQKLISQQVQNVDIFPTIAELINLDYKEPVQGRSLTPFFNSDLKELPAYLHTIPYEKVSKNDMVGIRTSKYKYFRGSRDPTHNVNLYDLQKDPHENQNIAKIKREVVNEMEKILSEMLSKHITRMEEKMNKDEENQIREELKKLGYL